MFEKTETAIISISFRSFSSTVRFQPIQSQPGRKFDEPEAINLIDSSARRIALAASSANLA